jgi:hypothetical protein
MDSVVIYQRGVIWSTARDPIYSNAEGVSTASGSSGSFQLDIPGLQPSTTYYVRAWARAIVRGRFMGDFYGARQQFTTTRSQTIEFLPLDSATYGDSPRDLVATASSGLPVSYSSTDTSIVRIQGGQMIFVGAGEAGIIASQPGDTTYEAAMDVSLQLVVRPKSLALGGFTVQDKVYDGTRSATVSGSASIVGVVAGDEVALENQPLIQFASADAAAQVAVSVEGAALTGTASPNYSLMIPALHAAISPKGLAVVAEDKRIELGEADPAWTFRFGGLVAGEDPSVVAGLVATRDPGDTLGDYFIHPSGGVSPNYLITYVDGILTIENPTVVATAAPVALEATSLQLATSPSGGLLFRVFVSSGVRFTLTVSDLQGRGVMRWSGTGTGGSAGQEFAWDLARLDNSRYWVALDSPTGQISRGVLVLP